jgi:hypothetical protein
MADPSLSMLSRALATSSSLRIVDDEIREVLPVPPGTAPNYNTHNPIWKVVQAVEGLDLAAEREYYLADSIQYLFPVTRIALYGPTGADWQVQDPRLQENKNDFQKQNVRHFDLATTYLARGYARAGDWTGPFLHLSHSPGADSPLNGADGHYTSPQLKAYLRVGGAAASSLINVPYNPESHRYEVELWGFPGHDLRPLLDRKGQAAIDRGGLQVRADLIKGSLADFRGPGFDRLRDEAKARGSAVEMLDVAPDHTIHPVRPLDIEVAWTTADTSRWDSRDGANYRYQFGMSLRGWDNYLGVGQSLNPHGGVGSLEFRNLYSNYFAYEQRRRQVLGDAWQPELGRSLEPWNVDAYGRKPPEAAREGFLAVDYMDLHILRPNCAIGIHRHRDNQEAFLMLQGRALMITGDWCQAGDRERAFEARTMKAGDLVLIKGGQVHALANTLDENVLLFMFGGYD